ncbi:MAG TPA: uroporphyrinogen decarboxylase family protein [Candidatus Hydrogenedentes bacterium]|nr:uroporphyrinogen decarboxylase family protein [Candidatus Hydrogenedentota bacterium]HOL77233.1 uroporphyrinogen decarboxylase family protein [Candidatus Hydrogenedentota bacterium]HPO86522.1 uroporphyrinogen decarboxylase family protein [Candidatus Hydrogenedentota bacterium]
MTAKECVKKVINLEPAPYVPLGFYVVDYDIVEAVIGRKTYVRNKVRMQIAYWEGHRDEVVQSLKEDTVEFFTKIDCCDIITFKEAPIVPPKDYEPPRVKRLTENTWQDERGCIWQASTLTNDISIVHVPDEMKKLQPRVEDYDGPVNVTPPDPSVYEACDYVIEKLGKERYIAGTTGGLTAMVHLPGESGGLLGYYLLPEVVHAAARRSVAIQNVQDAWNIRPGQDAVFFEQDMAASKGPMISPELFREFCLPYMKERVSRVRSLGKQVILHNCGNNRVLMDQFIEAGIQCYQSLQSIPDMELGGLKRDFGKHLAFWGGISLEVLLTGTPDDCRKNVRQAMETGAPGGGFILGPSHSIAKGTPYDNFMAVLDEYMRLRYAFS